MKKHHLLSVVLTASAFSPGLAAQSMILLKCEQTAANDAALKWTSSLEVNVQEKKLTYDGQVLQLGRKTERTDVKNGENLRWEYSITEWSDSGIAWEFRFYINGVYKPEPTRYRLDRISGKLSGPHSSGPCRRIEASEKLF
ncbi:hypothetical protein EGT29_13515 [Pigmentiphaga sp. H8]|uniref:hypothetical protein n=1 Tax=Pigmentiphaga sp. H8 TaxID=2488560 RepID=UPI000F5A3DDA|nr:hypothetical protein [Pigmentiphaga sp. H8]AZG08801.1 hypothetical protein EGT29_13515 [Pigmentiphaga sp. H8]